MILGCSPNSRYYEKGNIRLSADLSGQVATYRSLQIGTPEQPFDKNIGLYEDVVIEIVEGKPISLKEITIKYLEEHKSKVTDLDKLGYDSTWPIGSKTITVGTRIFFTVKGNRILYLYLNSVGLRPDERPPRLGLRNHDELVTMPLNQQNVDDLFGKSDNVNDVWHK